jgi:hypothetical protein
MHIVIILLLIDPLFIHTPRRRRQRSGSRNRRRRQHFRQTLEFLALPLDFANAFAALAADVFGQLDEAEDVFLFVEGKLVMCFMFALMVSGVKPRWLEIEIEMGWCPTTTYIAKVLDHVEELLRLFVLVAHFFDCFFDDEVFGDFGPHFVLGLALGRALCDSALRDADFLFTGRLWWWRERSRWRRSWVWRAEFALVDSVAGLEFASSVAVVALPCDFLAAAAFAVHAYALGSWWDVHEAPVSGCAVVGLTWVAT